jgi:hypothetical protein
MVARLTRFADSVYLTSAFDACIYPEAVVKLTGIFPVKLMAVRVLIHSPGTPSKGEAPHVVGWPVDRERFHSRPQQ